MNYRIEIQPPDISSYREGNAGVDYVHVLDSGKPETCLDPARPL